MDSRWSVRDSSALTSWWYCCQDSMGPECFLVDIVFSSPRSL